MTLAEAYIIFAYILSMFFICGLASALIVKIFLWCAKQEKKKSRLAATKTEQSTKHILNNNIKKGA